MFLGEFKHTIDEKGRLTIPAKFRNNLAAGLVLTRGLDQNLAVYPVAAFQELAEKINALGIANSRKRQLRRRIFSGATDLTPDRQGRILIPQNLRKFADIQGTVIVAGNMEYLEIWSESLWSDQREVIESSDSEEMWADLGF